MRLAMLALLGLSLFTVQTSAGIADMFESDSDFIRGFETGLFLRSKGGKVEDYNCVIPAEANEAAARAFDLVKNAVKTGMQALP